MSGKKLWQLIITNEETGHNDTWPMYELIEGTDQEIKALKKDIDAGFSSVYTALEAGHVPSVEEWRADHDWLVEPTGSDAESDA